MLGGRPVVQVEVGFSDYVLRASLSGVVGERLVAGKVDAGFGILGERHGRDIGYQRGQRAHEFGDFRCCLELLFKPCLFLFSLLLLLNDVDDVGEHQYCRHQKDSRDGHNLVDPALPSGVQVLDRNRNYQTHSVAQGHVHGALGDAFVFIFHECVVYVHALRSRRRIIHCRNIHERMVDQSSVRILEERIAAVMERYAVDDIGHCRIVDLDSENAHKGSVMIDGDIIGNDALVQIVRDVWRQPDRISLELGNGEPHKGGCIIRVIERYVRDLVLHKALSVKVHVPEALLRIRDRGVYPVVVRQDTLGLVGKSGKHSPCPFHMLRQLVDSPVGKIRFRIGGLDFNGLLHTLEVILELVAPGLSQKQEHLVGIAASDASDRKNPQERGNAHGDDYRQDHYCRYLEPGILHFAETSILMYALLIILPRHLGLCHN